MGRRSWENTRYFGQSNIHEKRQWWMCVSVYLQWLPTYSPPRPIPDLNVAYDSTSACVHHLWQRHRCDVGWRWWRVPYGVSVASTRNSARLLYSAVILKLSQQQLWKKRKKKWFTLDKEKGKYFGESSQQCPVCWGCEWNSVSKVRWLLRKWDEIYFWSCWCVCVCLSTVWIRVEICKEPCFSVIQKAWF